MSPIPTNPDGAPAGPKPPNPPTSASGVSGEPVGPYAPTRDGRTLNQRYEADPGLFEVGYRQGWRERDIIGEPRYPDLALDRVDALARDAQAAAKGDDRPLRGWLAQQFATANSGHVSTGTRIDGLVDVVLRQENRLTEHLSLISKKIDFLNQLDEPDGRDNLNEVTLTLAGYSAAKQAEYDRGVADGRASNKTPSEADQREREQACRDEGFRAGRKIGQAEREAELLEQGWTPPESMMVTVARIADEAAAEASTRLTDYELWRDALTLAGTNVFPIDGTGDDALTDIDRKAQILAEAEWWRDRLINWPNGGMKPDPNAPTAEDLF